jgi:hypothetical protein
MWEVKQHHPNLVELIYVHDKPIFDGADWNEYKQLCLKLLNDSDELLYIMSNFTAVDKVDPNITKEFGQPKHLFHEKLGMLVIMSENPSPFHRFWGKIMELKGAASAYRGKLRADFSWERGMERLKNARDNAKVNPKG